MLTSTLKALRSVISATRCYTARHINCRANSVALAASGSTPSVCTDGLTQATTRPVRSAETSSRRHVNCYSLLLEWCAKQIVHFGSSEIQLCSCLWSRHRIHKRQNNEVDYVAAQRFGCWTFIQALLGSIPGWGVIEALRVTQPSIPPG